MPKKIRVLVVDDSAFMRKALRRMLGSDPMIELVGEAKDGLQGLEMARRLKPDVITLDIQMPEMDGLQCLRRIMAEQPTPALMVSSLTSEGGEMTLRALSAGAVDFIDKSSCHTIMDVLDIADSLLTKVKVAAGVDVRKLSPAPAAVVPAAAPAAPRPEPAAAVGAPAHIVAIGASTGGPMALEKVVIPIGPGYPGAVLIVQHMPVGFTKSLADRLDGMSGLEIREAKEDDPVVPGRAYIAPGGYHLRLARRGDDYFVHIDKNPRDTLYIPSVDVLFRSVADQWPGRALAVVMTGMGADGAEGATALKARGATVVAQNEDTCVVYGMPRAAHLAGAVDRLVPLEKIADEIIKFK